MTLPQALAQSLQCPLLDPEAPAPRPMPAKGSLPSQHQLQTATPPPEGRTSAVSEVSCSQSQVAAEHATDPVSADPAQKSASVLQQQQQQRRQSTKNSFMVLGQRRVAKRPRVREHRRSA